MSIIKNLLQDEYNRLILLRKKYLEEIAKLPRGSISDKDRNNKEYSYQVYRESGKIKFKYIGKKSDNAVMKLREKIEKRKRLQELLKKTQNNIKEIERAVGGKKL